MPPARWKADSGVHESMFGLVWLDPSWHCCRMGQRMIHISMMQVLKSVDQIHTS